MTTQQLILAIVIPTLIPTLAVVVSILRNDSNVESLRRDIHSDMESLRNDLRADMESLRNDLRADIRILNTIAYEHNGRLAGLEGKKQA